MSILTNTKVLRMNARGTQPAHLYDKKAYVDVHVFTNIASIVSTIRTTNAKVKARLVKS